MVMSHRSGSDYAQKCNRKEFLLSFFPSCRRLFSSSFGFLDHPHNGAVLMVLNSMHTEEMFQLSFLLCSFACFHNLCRCVPWFEIPLDKMLTSKSSPLHSDSQMSGFSLNQRDEVIHFAIKRCTTTTNKHFYHSLIHVFVAPYRGSRLARVSLEFRRNLPSTEIPSMALEQMTINNLT